MGPLRSSFLVPFIFLLLTAIAPRCAHADEVAPALEGADLRVLAQSELKKLVATMSVTDQQRLAGVYVAFDPSVADPLATTACDDDGDDVVLVSDAMLRLLAQIARATSYDEENGTRKVEEYAAFLARVQISGRRLVPPPPGSYSTDKPVARYDERLADVLGFVIAGELARLRAGDLACPNPTTTKESGDDLWTPAEQRSAAETAKRIGPSSLDRDAEALARARAIGHSEKGLGAFAVVRFFAAFDAENRATSKCFTPSYVASHPPPATRLTNLKTLLVRDERERAHTPGAGRADAKGVTSAS